MLKPGVPPPPLRPRSYVGPEDMKWFYDAVDKGSMFCISFEDLVAQVMDMVKPKDRARGFTCGDLRRCRLAPGVIGVLTNHNNMLLHRTTAEWGRGEFPL